MILRILFYIIMLLSAGFIFFLDYEKISASGEVLSVNIIPSIIVLVIVGIAYELIISRNLDDLLRRLEQKVSTIPSLTHEKVIGKLLSEESLPHLFKASLENKIGNRESAKTLVDTIKMFLDDSLYLEKIELEIELGPPDEKGRYPLTVIESSPINPQTDTIRVAITDDRAAMSRLANYSNRLDKVYLVEDGKLPTSAKTLGQTLQVSVVDYSRGAGLTPQHQLRKASKTLKNSLLSDIDLSSSQISRVNIYTVKIDNISISNRLVYKFTSNENYEDGYCFWSTDRTSYLERIFVKYSSAIDVIEDVKLVEFVCSKNFTVHNEDGLIKAMINGWIFPGHGIAVKWRLKSDAI